MSPTQNTKAWNTAEETPLKQGVTAFQGQHAQDATRPTILNVAIVS